MTDKIERQVHFIASQPFDIEDTSGDNNSWNYNRAPDGYLFEITKIYVSTDRQNTLYNGLLALFDGHEYTHWNIWPGVQSQEMLTRMNFTEYELMHSDYFDKWECKEYTLGIRSTNATYGFKCCAILWYYLKKASRMELLEYAVKHPKNQDMFRHSLRGTTVEPTE